jgi:hypothetical protein
LTNWLRAIWNVLAGSKAPPSLLPGVIVHDPASKDPHDLDDPFFDRDVQARIGKAIAKATEEK